MSGAAVLAVKLAGAALLLSGVLLGVFFAAWRQAPPRWRPRLRRLRRRLLGRAWRPVLLEPWTPPDSGAARP
ncbi:hypothetical protein [Solimonas flava]|uniref:hypothetical protein n=1 Tax=Solimonas flava TaxID=415849 RepID=UPI00042334BC|nr:hypothetical protein [Solimonas flava]